jgi:hypothetical protein
MQVRWILVAAFVGGCGGGVGLRAGGQVFPGLAGEKGVVFSETPGGKVDMVVEGSPSVPLDDGEVVTYEDDDAGIGNENDATARILAREHEGRVPNTRVVTEARIVRTKDGQHAVFHAIGSCGDFCHAEIWVVDSEGKRVRLSDDGGSYLPQVALRPDGKELAVGSHALWLVSLPGLAVTSIDGVASPAYAPDGTLYVRDGDGSVFRMAGGQRTTVHVEKHVEHDEIEEGEQSDPEPVTFDAHGAPKWE